MNAAVQRLKRSVAGLSLDAYLAESYELREIDGEADACAYESLLEQTYEPMGFMRKELKPDAKSLCYLIRYRGTVVAIFRLTPIENPSNPIALLIPPVPGYRGAARLVEVNNVVIAAEFRSGILLGLLLYHCACIAHAHAFHRVVGATRHQVLRHFVDFGVVPVEHPPMRLLGEEHLLDFVIYYDTHSPESVIYMHERARRYFHQSYVLRSIQEKYVKPASGDRQMASGVVTGSYGRSDSAEVAIP